MLANLNKMCSTSAYMYLYSQRLLQGLEDAIRTGGGVHLDGEATDAAATGWAAKYRRLRQELEAGAAAAAGEHESRRSFAFQLATWHNPDAELTQHPALVRAT